MKNIGYAVIIGLLVGFICFQSLRSCTKDKPCQSVTVRDTVYLPGDTVPVTVYVPKPYAIKVKKPDSSEIWANPTLGWLADSFFLQKIYRQTLKDDTSAYIELIDTVYRNSLSSRLMKFQNRRPTAIINNVTTIQSADRYYSIFAGVGVGIGREQNAVKTPDFRYYTGLAPGISIMTDRNTVSASYDVLNGVVWIDYKLRLFRVKR